MRTLLATLCLLLCAGTAQAQAPRLAAVRVDAVTMHLWGHELVPGECYGIEICTDLNAGWEPYDDFVAFAPSHYLGSINTSQPHGAPRAAFFRLKPAMGLLLCGFSRPVGLAVIGVEQALGWGMPAEAIQVSRGERGADIPTARHKGDGQHAGENHDPRVISKLLPPRRFPAPAPAPAAGLLLLFLSHLNHNLKSPHCTHETQNQNAPLVTIHSLHPVCCQLVSGVDQLAV